MTESNQNLSAVTAILKHEDEKLYHQRSGEYLSSHQLRDFRKSPVLYIRKRNGLIPSEDCPAFLVGRALHCLAMEGRGEFNARYMTGGPINPKTNKPFGTDTKAFREWAAEQTREVLSEDQTILIEKMTAAIQQHDLASRLLQHGVAEGVVRHDYRGVACQIRLDYFHPNFGLIDLKTCDDIDYFEYDVKRYGYLYQLVFYRDILATAAGINPETIPCRFVVVEKKEPFRCGVWTITPYLLEDCSAQNQAAIQAYIECQTTGVWPTGYEEEKTFNAA